MARERNSFTKSRQFNVKLMAEEAEAITPGLGMAVSFGGFVRLTSNESIVEPSTEPRVMRKNMGVVELEAQPGEIFVDTNRVLTSGEITALGVAFHDHDERGLTTEQTEAAQDLTDVDYLETHHPTSSDATEQHKRMTRLLLRREGKL